MVRVLYLVALLFYFCNAQYLQQIKPVNYPGVTGFHGGAGLGFGNPGLGVNGLGGSGIVVPNHGAQGLGVPDPGSSELGGLDITARGLGGQRAEGVVQAQPDVAISSLPQSQISHKSQKPPSASSGGNGNYFEQDFLKFQPFKQANGHKARQSPINPYAGNFGAPISAGGYSGGNYLNLPQGNGIHGIHPSPINPYGGNGIISGGQLSAGPYSGINPGNQLPVGPYSGINPGNQLPAGPYSGINPGNQLPAGPYSGINSGNQLPVGPYSGINPGSQLPVGPYSGINPGVFPAGQVFPNAYSGINPGVIPSGEVPAGGLSGGTPEIATGVATGGISKEDLATGLYSGGLLKEEFFNIPQQNPGAPIPAKFSDNFPLVPSQVQVQKKNRSSNTVKVGQTLEVGNLNANKTGSLPNFLEGASQDVINKFKKILRQPQVPYSEKLKQVEDLVSGLDENRQKLFRQFVEENKTLENQRKVSSQKLRSPARNGFEEISSILEDQSLPENERWDQVVDVYRRLEPKIQNNLNESQK